MDEKMVSLRINDIPVTVPEGSTVLEAARSAGFNIPSLCFLKDINEIDRLRQYGVRPGSVQGRGTGFHPIV